MCGRKGTGGNVAGVTLCSYYGSKDMLTARSASSPSPYSFWDPAHSSLDTAVLIRHTQGSMTVEGDHKQEKTSFILK